MEDSWPLVDEAAECSVDDDAAYRGIHTHVDMKGGREAVHIPIASGWKVIRAECDCWVRASARVGKARDGILIVRV